MTSLSKNTNRALFALMLLSAGVCRAAARPDFSGTWKLNLARSGPTLPRGTEALTLVIGQMGTSVRTTETRTVSGVTTSNSSDAQVDGVEHVDLDQPEKAVRSKRWWSGDTLMTHWQTVEAGITHQSDIRQKLSSDGKVMRMLERYREPGVNRIFEWYFEKQN